MIRKLIIRICDSISFRLSKEKHPVSVINRNSMEGVLVHIKKLGFKPTTVIDIGAANGTLCLYDVFSDSFHFLVEPLVENEESLKELKKNYHLNYVIAALGSQEGIMKINVHADHLHGSSLLKEQVAEFDGVEREIAVKSLNKLCEEYELKGPFLLKIDTQGSELEILKGCTNIFKEIEFIIVETSFFEFYKDQPIVEDIIIYLKENGFTLFDVSDLNYRPLDGSCAQIDLSFVKKDSFFRKSNEYVSIEQWRNR